MRKRGRKSMSEIKDNKLLGRLISLPRQLPEHQKIKVGIAYHLALEQLWIGKGNDSHMNQLAYSMNLAMALCELGVMGELLPSITAAQDALVRANWISRKEGRWTLNEAAYETICEALSAQDQQVATATAGELLAAEKIIKSRLASGDVIHVDAVHHH